VLLSQSRNKQAGRGWRAAQNEVRQTPYGTMIRRG